MNKSIYYTSPETGFTYRRYPESKQRSHRVYWQRKIPGGVRYLHIDLWERANGTVPNGYHVHHKDHDPLNNSLDNLDCMSPQDHLSHHGLSRTEDQAEKNRLHLASIRGMAAPWHGSEEGKAWHSEAAKKSWVTRPMTTYVCGWCKASFESNKTVPAKFCSNKCKSAERYASGLDNIAVPCPGCGAERVINKYGRIPKQCILCHNKAKRKSI